MRRWSRFPLAYVVQTLTTLALASCGSSGGNATPANEAGADDSDGSTPAPESGASGADGSVADAAVMNDGGSPKDAGGPKDQESGTAPDAGALASTANPNATTDTKKLLTYLNSLRGKTGKHVISGQEIAPDDVSELADQSHYIGDLFTQTGKYPAYVEFGLGSGSSGLGIEDPADMQTVASAAIQWWTAGGLVGVFVSLGNPTGGGIGSSLAFTSSDAHDLVTAGTATNATFNSQLDAVAVALDTLQQAGVVVLWRVFHEMNGNWNWWSMGDNGGHIVVADYIAIWTYAFNYFTTTKQLNNLLWVYSPNAGSSNSVATYFPGSKYVDVGGMDFYDPNVSDMASNGYGPGSALTVSWGLCEYGPGGPTGPATGNFDNKNLIDAINSSFPNATFFKYWTSWSGASIAIVDNQDATGLMNDPSVITRTDLDWR
jgi:mannan endo-1,4-beta-mannosidase